MWRCYLAVKGGQPSWSFLMGGTIFYPAPEDSAGIGVATAEVFSESAGSSYLVSLSPLAAAPGVKIWAHTTKAKTRPRSPEDY
jgi:hypothetical protein